MATAKSKKKRELDINRVLSAIDYKNYDFYSSLNEKELKEFSPYVWMSFSSNRSHNLPDVEEWYVETTNEFVNKNYFQFGTHHKELLWKLYAATGTGEKTSYQYLKPLTVDIDPFEKLLCDLYPAWKIEDVKLLASLMTKEERQELFDNMGFDKKERKQYE